MNVGVKNSILGILIIAYAASCCITTLPFGGMLPIQISEIIFLFMLPFAPGYFRNVTVTRIDKILFLYLGIFLLNAAVHVEAVTRMEVAGTIYLVVMSLLLSRFFAEPGNYDKYLPKAMYGLYYTCIITGLGGYILHSLGISDYFGHIYGNYPYFGDIWRLDGLTWCNLLLSCIAFSTFFILSFEKKRERKILFAIAGLITGAFTVSKEMVIYAALLGIAASNFLSEKKYHLLIKASCLVLAVFMVCATFFAVKVKEEPLQSSHLTNETQIGEDVLFASGNFAFHGTTYFYMAKSAVTLLKDNILFGVGSGQFRDKLSELQEKGEYPPKLNVYDTHDFYLGQLSELGIFYMVFLVFFLRESFMILENKRNFDRELYIALVLTLSYFLISFLVGGSKHYRHFWVFLGLLNSCYIRSNRFQNE